MEKKRKVLLSRNDGKSERQATRLRVLFASRILTASAAGGSKLALTLTRKQKAEVRSVLEAEGQRVMLLAGQLTKNSRQLQIVNGNRVTDTDQLQPLFSQRRQLEAELQAVKELLLSRLFEILTDEQRAVLQADLHP